MKVNINSLPNPPADVLAMFDQMPPDLMERIQLQMVVYSGIALINLGREPTEEEFHKLLLRSGDKFCRLIRKAAAEAGINE